LDRIAETERWSVKEGLIKLLNGRFEGRSPARVGVVGV